MSFRKLVKENFISIAGVVGLLMLLPTVMFPQSVNADTTCTYPFCSETFNQSQYWIIVAHDWCGNSESLYQDAPPCGWGSQTAYLNPGEHTPSHEDWDALRVDKGWQYVVQVYSVIFGWSSVGDFDQRNSSTHLWIHVHGDQTYYVLNQIS